LVSATHDIAEDTLASVSVYQVAIVQNLADSNSVIALCIVPVVGEGRIFVLVLILYDGVG